MRLNSKGLYLSSEKGKRKLSYVQVLQKTDMKERSVKSWIVRKVINKKRNLCSCKVVSFAFFAVFVAVGFVVAYAPCLPFCIDGSLLIKVMFSPYQIAIRADTSSWPI